jgi:hypothetical protein
MCYTQALGPRTDAQADVIIATQSQASPSANYAMLNSEVCATKRGGYPPAYTDPTRRF